MSHYVVVNLIVTDAELLATYRESARPAVQKHGGKVVAAGPNEALEDNGAGPLSVVVIEFPDAEAARAWFNDPDLADTHAIRNKAAKSSISMVPAAGG